MNSNGNQRKIASLAAAVCAFAALAPALAGTPLSRDLFSASTVASGRPAAALVRPIGAGARALDLRPAGYSAPSPAGGAIFARAVSTSAAASHHFGIDDRAQLTAAGTVDESLQTMSLPQRFSRRVQREGLPVARLWENKSALVSIGLNQKGKPGLWLIQKIR
jgi:hypothetical protein